MLSAILGSVAVLSAGINIWQWLAARRFPLHQRVSMNGFRPAITLLKPLKGADDETPVCLESWLAQDYSGEVQLLFGVADTNDPVCNIVRDLIRLYPERDIELVICNPIRGANAKVSTLTYLEKKAKHDFVVVSDADVFAPEDLLFHLAQRFESLDTDVVNCFYKLARPRTAAMIWESIAVNADFWSQVCQGLSIRPMDFALGAVMGIRRQALDKIGGFEPLLNHLADDFQLGNRIYEARKPVRPPGVKWRIFYRPIQLSGIIVECREAPKSFVEVWKHQLRWARTIRVCQPGPYFGSILSNTTVFVLAWVAVAGWTPAGRVCIVVRILTAIANHARLTGRGGEALFAPVKDVLQFFVWAAAFVGNTVTWRGEKFRVKPGGELVRI